MQKQFLQTNLFLASPMLSKQCLIFEKIDDLISDCAEANSETRACACQLLQELNSGDPFFMSGTNRKNKQEKADGVSLSKKQVPHGYQSIVYKIKGGFSFMKRAEFEIWTLFYSEYVLKYMVVSDRLPGGFKQKHYLNWILFVQACRIIVSPSISIRKAEEARELLRSFCRGYALLFGPESIKPNFHYSLHLYDNVPHS